jgi:asparagine synthetase B (glutamine-hydrolysing)
MPEDRKTQGDYTLFGYSHDIEGMKRRIFHRLGIEVQTIDIGERGHFFYYSSYGDIAETVEAVVIKLGFLRSITKSPLDAFQLAEQHLVGPGIINPEGFRGNGLVIGISKKEPVFAAFQTLMAVPQLYYSVSLGGIVCSDILRILIQVLPNVEFNEDVLPQHFLFRSVYGSATYFRGIERLIPGQYLRWVDGKMEIRLARSFEAIVEEAEYIKEDSRVLKLISESLEGVIGDYVSGIEAGGQGYANLFSGGVDSSLVQYFLNIVAPEHQRKSISYAIKVPAFDFEVEYAQQASQILHTEHTFVDYKPQDYPGLLTRVIEVLAQPPNLETEPSFLAVAEYLHKANWSERYYFTGQGGDTLFGGEAALKLKGLEFLRRIPGAGHILNGMGKVVAPFNKHHSHTLIRGAEIIANRNNPDFYMNPANSVCVYVLDENWDILRRMFGDQTLKETLAMRRELAGAYSKSKHYLDRVYFIDLVTDLWELAVERNCIFLNYNFEQLSPFFDEDLIKAALTVHPDIRYIKGLKFKHLLKQLLEQKTKNPVVHMRTGPSNVNDDLVAWMNNGSLRLLVEEIDRPNFLTKADYKRMLRKPDYFLWPLLTYDIFEKRVVQN